MATQASAIAKEETSGLPLVEVVRLADRKPAEPSEARIHEVEARLLKSPFVANND